MAASLRLAHLRDYNRIWISNFEYRVADVQMILPVNGSNLGDTSRTFEQCSTAGLADIRPHHDNSRQHFGLCGRWTDVSKLSAISSIVAVQS